MAEQEAEQAKLVPRAIAYASQPIAPQTSVRQPFVKFAANSNLCQVHTP
ncbi:hypothetical protein ACQ4M4_10415 [Leptolyngbya sp. AN02str]